MTTFMRKLAAFGLALVLGGQVLMASAGGDEGPYPVPGVPENTIVQGSGDGGTFPPEQPAE